MAAASLDAAKGTILRDVSAEKIVPRSGSTLRARIVRNAASGFALDADFEIPAGFTMLLGPSGGGKTTILNCIAGLVRPDAGRIELDSRLFFDSASGVDLPVAERRVGYLFQTLALFPHLTIEQNVAYGIAKLPAAERRARIDATLSSFRITHLLKSKPGEISGGERQRAALARSLVTDPTIMLFDEPLTALDNATKSDIINDLRKWNAEHRIPILYVTHSPDEAFALGERVVVIQAGRVIARGMPHEVLSAPRHETIAQIVGFENVFDAVVLAHDERQGTMLCRLGSDGRELEVPLTRDAIGAPVRIAIRAGDIIISAERPHGLSARNSFKGRVIEVRHEGVRVVVIVEAGVRFEIHVTPSACDELGLEGGKPVWLVIKSYSCNLVATGDGGS
ncbi:MAG TPA: molybdenum ABC transporter ATP-binding protein [Candidatus Binataceae bacterium]|nr:molybdenum ABC transporter ATP-binding protein [Candidatus Binataceae bacterium]